MKNKNWKIYGLWVLICEAVGLVSGLLSRSGIAEYTAEATKPPLSLPAWLFPVVWTVLFALMGIAMAKIVLAAGHPAQKKSMNLFIAQLIVNFFWPLLFFNLQAYGLAFLWLVALWVLVLATIRSFWKVDEQAAWLLTPYLAWLTFAAYLNLGVLMLN